MVDIDLIKNCLTCIIYYHIAFIEGKKTWAKTVVHEMIDPIYIIFIYEGDG